MNKDRRKAIQGIIDHLHELDQKITVLLQDFEDTKDAIDDILDEEENYRDNIPENLQDGERYNKADRACDYLSSASSHIENILYALEGDYESVTSDLETAME